MKRSIMLKLAILIIIIIGTFYPVKLKTEEGVAPSEIFMFLLSGSDVDFTMEKKSVDSLPYWDGNFDLVGSTALVGGTSQCPL